MRLAVPLLTALLSAALASAAESVPAGYVVRVDGGSKVFLDLNRSSGLSLGSRFKIYKEGEQLRHPVTKESLGPIIEDIASGTITEVREKYSVGVIKHSEGNVQPGQKARIVSGTRRPPPAPTAAAAVRHAPYYRAPAVNFAAVDIAIGDVDGDGKPEAVLAGERTVQVFPLRSGAEKWNPLCVYEDKTTGTRFLSVETGDLDGDGKAEIFVTLHSSFFKRIESAVLVCEDGHLKRKTSFPWMVRSVQKADGSLVLAAQQVIGDGAFPFSAIFELEYAKGRYRPSARRIKHKRLEWLYGFGFSRRKNHDCLLTLDRSNRLRIYFNKGKWISPQKYGQTAARIRWHEHSLEFHPRMIIEQDSEGLNGLYTLRNVAAWYDLASSFGMFKQSELHYLRWNDLALEPVWKADITGYAAGLAEYSDGASLSLLVPVLGPEGDTSVWFFRK